MLADNTPIETIKNNLIIAGWDPLVINEALNEVRITDSQIDTSDSDTLVPKKRKKGGDYFIRALSLNVVGFGSCFLMGSTGVALGVNTEMYEVFFIYFLSLIHVLSIIFCIMAFFSVHFYKDPNTGLKSSITKRIFISIASIILSMFDVLVLMIFEHYAWY